jgi:hypothetical protein
VLVGGGGERRPGGRDRVDRHQGRGVAVLADLAMER